MPEPTANQPIYNVAVYCYPRPGRAPVWTAYTRDYNRQWPGTCMHAVRAINSTRAKQQAIAACKAHRATDQEETPAHAH